MPPLFSSWPVMTLVLLSATASAAEPSPAAPVTIEGQARDAKGGAVVLTAAGEVLYVVGLDAWPAAIEGRAVRVTGQRTQAHHLPEAEVGPDGAISQGVEPGSGPQEVLRDCTWLLAPDPALVPAAPWALRWADGNGNVARAWQDGSESAARLSWHPVRPENSSSGMYSGGEPRLEGLESDQVAELWALARTVQWTAPRAETRSMGTGQLTVTVPGAEEQALVAAGAASAALDAWLGGR